MINVEHICERKYFYWATWEGWMNLFLLSYPKYIIKSYTYKIQIIPAICCGGNFMAPAVWCAVCVVHFCTYYSIY